MRALCLLLIIANLAFLGWAQFVDAGPSEEVRAVSAPPVAQRLLLATEVRNTRTAQDETTAESTSTPASDPASNAAAPKPDATTLAAASPSCLSVGPFRDLAAAVQGATTLQSAGFSPRQRLEQGELWVGYWVNLQDLPGREAAENAMTRLKEHGVTDAYIMPSTDSSSILSLGIFSDHGRAQRRADEIRSYGFDPQITDRKRTGAAYWLDVDLTPDKHSIDPSILQTEPGKVVRLEIQPCPTAAGANG